MHIYYTHMHGAACTHMHIRILRHTHMDNNTDTRTNMPEPHYTDHYPVTGVRGWTSSLPLSYLKPGGSTTHLRFLANAYSSVHHTLIQFAMPLHSSAVSLLRSFCHHSDTRMVHPQHSLKIGVYQGDLLSVVVSTQSLTPLLTPCKWQMIWLHLLHQPPPVCWRHLCHCKQPSCLSAVAKHGGSVAQVVRHEVDSCPVTWCLKWKLYKFGICPRLNWPLTIHEFPIWWIERELEAMVARFLKPGNYSTTIYNGSTWLHLILLHSIMVLLGSTLLYHGFTWLFFTLLHSIQSLLDFTWCYYTLSCAEGRWEGGRKAISWSHTSITSPLK